MYRYTLIALAFASTLALAQNTPSPAQAKIAAAEKLIETNLERSTPNVDAYNQLALAYAKRARETADPTYYDKAQSALDQSFKLKADDIEARKLHVWLLLGKHEFAQAAQEARQLNKKIPDDLQVYGFLVDANAELGDYKAAEEAAQWMLDLRAGNVPGLTRAAYLRELFGDNDGALDLMRMAYQRTPDTESEERAWLLTQIGHLLLAQGKLESSEKALDEALKLFPDYHYALAQLAKVRAAQNRHADAAVLLQKRYDGAPHPENLFDLAQALARAGKQSDARRAYAQFEKQALAESDKWDNSNRELIFYYADVARKPNAALAIAEKEAARRQDVHTLHAHAWALFKAGRVSDARAKMDQALAVGIRDTQMTRHALAIARAQGDRAAVARLNSVAMNNAN